METTSKPVETLRDGDIMLLSDEHQFPVRVHRVLAWRTRLPGDYSDGYEVLYGPVPGAPDTGLDQIKMPRGHVVRVRR